MLLGTLFAEKATEGFVVDQNIQGSYNPLGLQLVTKMYYSVPLVHLPGVLWESTRIDFGIQNNLSPGYDLAGIFINIEPIAVFNLTLTAQATSYFKALGYGFYSLSGYGAGFDGPALDALTSQNAFGYIVSAAPTFKIAAGPIVVLDTGTFTYFNAGGGNGYFYERIGNTVLAGSDIELANQAYVLTTILPGLLCGVNDSLLYVPASGYVSHRINAIGIYTIKLTGTFSVYAALTAGTFLADRYFQYKLYAAGQAGVTLRL